MMIILFGHSNDPIIRGVRSELEAQGHVFAVVDPNDAVFESQLTWDVGSSWNLQLNPGKGKAVEISGSVVTAAFWRSQFPLSPSTTEFWSSQDLSYMAKEGYATLLGLLHGSTCVIVNEPIPGGRSRFFFADYTWERLLEDHSIGIPEMCLATSTTGSTQFCQEVLGKIRILPLGSAVSQKAFANPMGLSDWNYSKSPLCLQAIAPGEWFHMINVGSEVRGGPIAPQIGYGSFETGVEPQFCPSPLITKYLTLSNAYDLEFSESIWMQDEYEQWFCLDWNCVPQLHHWGPAMQQEVLPLLAHLLAPKV